MAQLGLEDLSSIAFDVFVHSLLWHRWPMKIDDLYKQLLHMVSFHSHVLLIYPGAQNCIKSSFEVVRGQKKLHNNFLAHPFLWVHDGARAPRKHLVYLPALAANDFLMLWARRTAANLPSGTGLHQSCHGTSRLGKGTVSWRWHGMVRAPVLFSHVFPCYEWEDDVA